MAEHTCPKCGYTFGSYRICARCKKGILKHHKYFQTHPDSKKPWILQVQHLDCENPSRNPGENERSQLRSEEEGKINDTK